MKKKTKNERLQALRMLIASHELGTQEEVLKALRKEGFETTQATLSRDFKRLKVAKASNMKGRYYYVLPGEAAYKRVSTPRRTTGMQLTSGFVSFLRQYGGRQDPSGICRQFGEQHRQLRLQHHSGHRGRPRHHLHPCQGGGRAP